MNEQDEVNEQKLRDALRFNRNDAETDQWLAIYRLQRITLPPDEAMAAASKRIMDAMVEFLDERRKKLIISAARGQVLAEIELDLTRVFDNSDNVWDCDLREEIMAVVRQAQEVA